MVLRRLRRWAKSLLSISGHNMHNSLSMAMGNQVRGNTTPFSALFPLYVAGEAGSATIHPYETNMQSGWWRKALVTTTPIGYPGAFGVTIQNTNSSGFARYRTQDLRLDVGMGYLVSAVVREGSVAQGRLFLANQAGTRLARATLDLNTPFASTADFANGVLDPLPVTISNMRVDDLGDGFRRISAVFTPLVAEPEPGQKWTFGVGTSGLGSIEVFEFGTALWSQNIITAGAPVSFADKLTWLGPSRVVVDILSHTIPDALVSATKLGVRARLPEDTAATTGALVYGWDEGSNVEQLTQLNTTTTARANASGFTGGSPAAHNPANWLVQVNGVAVTVSSVHRLSLLSRERRASGGTNGEDVVATRHRAVLTLDAPVPSGASVVVTPPGGTAISGSWSASARSEAVCVSHLGYHPKQAKIGALWTWFGNTANNAASGNITAATIAGDTTDWKIVNADTGADATGAGSSGTTMTWERGDNVTLSDLPLGLLNIGELTLVSGGSGYTSDPTISITPVAVAGTAPTVTYTRSGGVITAINMTAAGTATYRSDVPLTVTLTGGGATTQAVITAKTTRPNAPYNSGGPVLTADFTAFETPGHWRLEVAGVGSSVPFRIRKGVGEDLVRVATKAAYLLRRRAIIDPLYFPTTHPYGATSLGQTCAWPHMETRLPLLGTSEGPGDGYDKHDFFFETQPYITAIAVDPGDGKVTVTVDADPTLGVLTHTPGTAGGWDTGTKVLTVDGNSALTGPRIPQMSHKIWSVVKLTETTYHLKTEDGSAFVDGRGWPAFVLGSQPLISDKTKPAHDTRSKRFVIGRYIERVDYAHSDAADLDSRVQHLDMMRTACGLAYFSAKFRGIKAGIPETATAATFTIYDRRTNTDQTLTIPASAPDPVKEYCWTLAGFCSLQRSDGAVYGGGEISRYQFEGGSKWTLGADAVPYVYSPDPYGAYQLAASAALLAFVLPIICPDAGDAAAVSATATVLRERALRAYTWANANRVNFQNLPQGVGGSTVSRDSDNRYRRARLAAGFAITLGNNADAVARGAAEAELTAQTGSTLMQRNTLWDGAACIWAHVMRTNLAGVTQQADVATILGRFTNSIITQEFDRLNPAGVSGNIWVYDVGGTRVVNNTRIGTGLVNSNQGRAYYDDSPAQPTAALRLGMLAMAYWSDAAVMTANRKGWLRAALDREAWFLEGANPYGSPLIAGIGPSPITELHWRDHWTCGGGLPPFIVAMGPISTAGFSVAQAQQHERHILGGGWPAGSYTGVGVGPADYSPIPGPLYWSGRRHPMAGEPIMHVSIQQLLASGALRAWYHAELAGETP